MRPKTSKHPTEIRELSRGIAWPGGIPGERASQSYDADYWRQRAEEARALAETMKLPAARHEIEQIAAAYGKLSESAERTAGRKGTRERN